MLPDLTHLQFLILTIVSAQKRPGRFVRDRLAKEGERKSLPAFYQLMARLEEAGLIEGWYEQKTVGGTIVKERWYKITGAGIKAWQRTRDFYEGSNVAAFA